MNNLEEIYSTGKKNLEKIGILKWCETTAKFGNLNNENRNYLDKIKLVFKIFHEKFTPDISTSFLGFKSDLPFYTAPLAGLNKVNVQGEKILVDTCSKLNIPIFISDGLQTDLKELVNIAKTSIIQILKPFTNIDNMEKAIKDAENSGVSAIGVNVDIMYGVQSDAKITMLKNFAPSDPNYYKKIRKFTSLPMFIKGVMHLDDIIKIQDYKYNGAVLSNHGGRVLDSLASPLTNLSKVSQNCDLDILVDGEFRRGMDIYKALALGAKGVLIGRPVLYALSSGDNSLENMFGIYKKELLRICGLTDVRDIKFINNGALSF